jgi:hypothetical protein
MIFHMENKRNALIRFRSLHNCSEPTHGMSSAESCWHMPQNQEYASWRMRVQTQCYLSFCFLFAVLTAPYNDYLLQRLVFMGLESSSSS